MRHNLCYNFNLTSIRPRSRRSASRAACSCVLTNRYNNSMSTAPGSLRAPKNGATAPPPGPGGGGEGRPPPLRHPVCSASTPRPWIDCEPQPPEKRECNRPAPKSHVVKQSAFLMSLRNRGRVDARAGRSLQPGPAIGALFQMSAQFLGHRLVGRPLRQQLHLFHRAITRRRLRGCHAVSSPSRGPVPGLSASV